MNLILSGVADETLLEDIRRTSFPCAEVVIDSDARRFEGVDTSDSARGAVAHFCNKASVDHTYVAPSIRLADFKAIVFDMDSTLINIECIDELATLAGRGEEVKAITRATMSGERRNFASSFEDRVALLSGANAEILHEIWNHRLALNPGARAVVEAFKLQGAYTTIVSGGFNFFARRVAKQLGVDEYFANELELINGRISGRTAGPIVDGDFKAQVVQKLAKRLNCSLAHIAVVGDGANDIPMMRIVTHSVAYHAKSLVRAAAMHRIDFGGLEVILRYLDTAQGRPCTVA